MATNKERERTTDYEERQRESGEPGGGKGRVEDVSGSGVYPMSGPHPSGNAETQPPASWGQGDRGAEGYEDSGTSEVLGPDELQNE